MSEERTVDKYIDRIVNADCMDVMDDMPDECIDLTVTSPPYDNLRTYGDTLDWSFDIFREIAGRIYRVTKQGGVVVWIVNDATVDGSETGTSFRQALYFKEIGFNLHDTMIWVKPNCFNFGSNRCYRQSFEYMFILSKGVPKTIHLISDVPAKSAGQVLKGARKHSDGSRDVVPDFMCSDFRRRQNVWSVNVGIAKKSHPAIFPEKLVKDHILSWSDEGDIVMDPFMGSGTTAIACRELDRRFIGMEKNPEYWRVCQERLEENDTYQPMLPLF